MANKTNIRRYGRKALSILLTLVMLTSLLQISVFAEGVDYGDGSAENPWKIGATVEGETEPEGMKAEHSVWQKTEVPTTYATDPSCGKEEHAAHVDGCYELICGYEEEHTHDAKGEGCQAVICGQDEHIHGAGCCSLNQHTHGFLCGNGRLCLWTEHTHGTNCNTEKCGVEVVHTHEDGCYAVCEKIEHTHSELDGDCYNLICTTEIHTHSIEQSCFAVAKEAHILWTLVEATYSANVTVKLNGGNASNAAVVLKNSAGETVAESTTDNHGVASFSGLKVGTYTATATASSGNTNYRGSAELSVAGDGAAAEIELKVSYGKVEANLFYIYSNQLPDEINKPFDAAKFGPSGDNTALLTITVDLDELLEKTGMTMWTRPTTNDIYLSVDNSDDKYDHDLDSVTALWTKILAATDEDDQAALKAKMGEGQFIGYVLKREGGSWHIDGILATNPPVYVVEIYHGNQAVKVRSKGVGEGQGEAEAIHYATTNVAGEDTVQSAVEEYLGADGTWSRSGNANYDNVYTFNTADGRTYEATVSTTNSTRVYNDGNIIDYVEVTAGLYYVAYFQISLKDVSQYKTYTVVENYYTDNSQTPDNAAPIQLFTSGEVLTLPAEAAVEASYREETKDYNGKTYTYTDISFDALTNTYILRYDYETPTYTLTVKHVDESGADLVNPIVTLGLLEGAEYDTEPATIAHYTFKEMAANSAAADGQIAGDTTVIYVYTQNTYELLVNYVDTEGNTLHAQIRETGLTAGTSYTTEQKSFEGYSFLRTEGNAVSGKIAGDTEVTYVYEEIVPPATYSLTVNYVDENGKVLADQEYSHGYLEGDTYTTVQKSIDEYTFLRTEGDAVSGKIAGNTVVTYVYSPVTYTLTVQYVDESGAALADDAVSSNWVKGQEYATVKLGFDGYVFKEMGAGSDAASGTIAGDTTVIYVYKAVPKAYTYEVVHAYYQYVNGGNTEEYVGQSAPSQYSATETSLPSIDEIFDAQAKADSFNGDTYQRLESFASGEITRGGNLESGNLVYTVKYYASKWTMGSLKIQKMFRGLDQTTLNSLKNDLSFVVTGPNGYEQTVKYNTYGMSLSNLEPGTYTITENNAEIANSGYVLNVIATDIDSNTPGYQVNVVAGANAATFSILNNYESQVYNIWFDGGEHGTMKRPSGNEVDGIWRNRWLEFQPNDEEPFYDWSFRLLKTGDTLYELTNDGSTTIYSNLIENPTVEEVLEDANNTKGLALYSLTWAEWVDYSMGIAKPNLSIDSGWESDKEFYLDGGATAFESMAKTIEYLNSGAVDPDVNGIYNAYYVAKYTQKEIEQPKTGSLTINKTASGASVPAGATFTISGPDGYTSSVVYVNMENGSYTFEDIPVGAYTVTETNAGVSGYTLATTSDLENGAVSVNENETAVVNIVNTYTEIPTPPSGGNGGDNDPDPVIPETPVDIPEEDVPMTDLPEEEPPLADLPDEGVPMADVPKTGDEMLMYIMMAAASGMGLVALALTNKKREEEAAE